MRIACYKRDVVFPGALANPLRDNPLLMRADVARASLAVFRPLLPYFSPGGARIRLGSSGALFGTESESLEGFARPLYGIVPLTLGGSEFEYWDLYRRGLSNGTNPAHPEYWGMGKTDQRMVERAALGIALAFTPEKIWEPLEPKARDHLADWLTPINEHWLPENNWQFFRVMVNLGLATVGRKYDERAHQAALDCIESQYDADGYYHDGPVGRVDYYVAWALHTYGLIYASSPAAQPDYARRYRERARAFARHFQQWFDEAGAAVAFGRSQTYRFAQGAFWGALAWANEEALPWARIKGLYLRHLRYWSQLPIADRDGVISLGYAYNNLHVCEAYSSPCSPYWCMKGFLGLAAPDDHPFWTTPEETGEAFEAALPRITAEPQAGMVFQRGGGHVTLLNAGQAEPQFVNMPAKYGKFCYSSYFGFSVAQPENQPEHGVHDSMLALREETGPWRVRVISLEQETHDHVVHSLWRPWPTVTIETRLIACGGPWHVRMHRIQSDRLLQSSEQGFSLGRDGSDDVEPVIQRLDGDTGIIARTSMGSSGIFDVTPRDSKYSPFHTRREASLQTALPNTHLIWPRTFIPRLMAPLSPGVHILACVVLAHRVLAADESEIPPEVPLQAWDWLVAVRPNGAEITSRIQPS